MGVYGVENGPALPPARKYLRELIIMKLKCSRKQMTDVY